MKMSKLSNLHADMAARVVARARLPRWLALLMPVIALTCIFGLTTIIAWASFRLHQTVHPRAQLSDRVVGLSVIGALIIAVAPGLLLGNYILGLVPPIRKLSDRNTKGVRGAPFHEAMRGLLKAACILAPVGAILIVLATSWP